MAQRNAWELWSQGVVDVAGLRNALMMGWKRER